MSNAAGCLRKELDGRPDGTLERLLCDPRLGGIVDPAPDDAREADARPLALRRGLACGTALVAFLSATALR